MNESDQYHMNAKKFSKIIRVNNPLFLTEGIILELGDLIMLEMNL